VFKEFMGEALEDKPAIPFRTPPGIRMVRIDAETGKLASPSSNKVIEEAFKAGTEPGANSNGVIITGNGSPILPVVKPGEVGEETGADSQNGEGSQPFPANNAPVLGTPSANNPTAVNPASPAAPSGIY
jgi:penicillin-binding protein 1A